MSEVVRLIYGTGNPAKLDAMRKRLGKLSVEIIGLRDLDDSLTVPVIAEEGHTPLENAEQKALRYYRAFRMPVFSCDSGMYIDGLPEELQPGVHVRTVRDRYLSDEEMQEYYASLAERYGEERTVPTADGREEKVRVLKARYRNAICLVLDEAHIYKAMEESMASEPFLISSKPHPVRQQGFPLDSLSVDIRTGRYYYDLEEERLEQVAVEDGFLEFFRQILG